MLDRDLAKLYGVPTKRLNEAVKRNLKRFPPDFMFSLTQSEKEELVANCDHLKKLKHSYQLPYVFTENGVAMLSSVLRSERAIQVNIVIMRAFTRLRQILAGHKELARKVEELEHRYSKHELEISVVFKVLKKLMEKPIEEQPRKKIGFDV